MNFAGYKMSSQCLNLKINHLLYNLKKKKRMNKLKIIFTLILIESFHISRFVDASGRLMDPISRSSCWRKFSSECPTEFNDNMQNCGGIDTQFGHNDGKCSICGEDWSLSTKRFELGGSMYTGKVVNEYRQGQQIEAKIELVSNRGGWFEFRLCNRDNLDDSEDATQECLDENLLKDESGKTRFKLNKSQKGLLKFKLQLPRSLTCKNCVFQWKYHTGSNWGHDEDSGKSCVGCGPQEEFYGCSDIKITKGNSSSIRRRFKSKTTTTTSTTEAPLLESTEDDDTTTTTTRRANHRKSNSKKAFHKHNLSEKDSEENEPARNEKNSRCPRGDGMYRNKSDCGKYYICINTKTPFEQIKDFKCPAGLKFDTNLKICNWANNVKCPN
jgi:hypothetical protein